MVNDGRRVNRNKTRNDHVHRFRDSVAYAITNMEREPEKGEVDRRTAIVVICRNNPTHIVTKSHLPVHLKEECCDVRWGPGANKQNIPSF